MTTVYAYLNEDKFDQLQGTDKTALIDGRKYEGFTIYHTSGRWYFNIDLVSPIPAELQKLVVEYSLYAFIPSRPYRERGIYQRADAKAEVDWLDTKHNQLSVKIRGTSRKEISDLFDAIRIGKIRPVESFDGNQNGKSRSEIEDDLEKVQNELASCQESLRQKEYALGCIGLVAEKLERSWWMVLCFRWLAARNIRRAAAKTIPVSHA